MIHPAHQLNLAADYFKKLSSNDISVQYYNGLKAPTLSFWDKLKISFNTRNYYEELLNFYPYHQVIRASYQTYEKQTSQAIKQGLIISAVTVLGIYQLAKRGVVLPILNKYGRIFQTHRIFRHYIYALTLPTFLLYSNVNGNHLQNVTQLWNVHARRLSNKVLSDPNGTEYPQNLKTSNIVWKNNIYPMRDILVKVKSEVPLQQSQLYENPEFETVDFGQAGVEQTED